MIAERSTTIGKLFLERSLSTLLLVVLTVGCSSQQNYSSVEIGEAAPTFALTDAASGDIVKSDSLQGEVVVVAFWSTSCPNCVREIDDLKSIHASKKAHVVGIALDDDRDRVLGLVKKKGVDYQVLMGNQDTFDRFDGFSIPYTIILDRDRKIRKKFHGRMTKGQFEEVYEAIHGSARVAMRG
jgi:peroxiredoxin